MQESNQEYHLSEILFEYQFKYKISILLAKYNLEAIIQKFYKGMIIPTS